MRIQFFIGILAVPLLAAGCNGGSNNSQNSNLGAGSQGETRNASPNVNVYTAPAGPMNPNISTANASANSNNNLNENRNNRPNRSASPNSAPYPNQQ